jgi:hypothetical protein
MNPHEKVAEDTAHSHIEMGDMFMKYIAILCDYYRVALHIPLPPL